MVKLAHKNKFCQHYGSGISNNPGRLALNAAIPEGDLFYCVESRAWKWTGSSGPIFPEHHTVLTESVPFFCQTCMIWLNDAQELAKHEVADFCRMTEELHSLAFDVAGRHRTHMFGIFRESPQMYSTIHKVVSGIPSIVASWDPPPVTCEYLDYEAALLCPMCTTVVMGRHCLEHHLPICRMGTLGSQVLLPVNFRPLYDMLYPGTRIPRVCMRVCYNCNMPPLPQEQQTQAQLTRAKLHAALPMFFWVSMITGLVAKSASYRASLRNFARTYKQANFSLPVKDLLAHDVLNPVIVFF